MPTRPVTVIELALRDYAGDSTRTGSVSLFREEGILLAPFSGRITSVHVTQGTVVAAGVPVVTLTLMDRVQVEVSADDERAIQTGDRAIIYPQHPRHGGRQVPVNAIVFEKSAVADPKEKRSK